MSIRSIAAATAAFEERHRTVLAAAQWLCFAVTCASFAGFVRLPEIAIPALVGVALTFLRYAVWTGVVKPRLFPDRPGAEPGTP